MGRRSAFQTIESEESTIGPEVSLKVFWVFLSEVWRAFGSYLNRIRIWERVKGSTFGAGEGVE